MFVNSLLKWGARRSGMYASASRPVALKHLHQRAYTQMSSPPVAFSASKCLQPRRFEKEIFLHSRMFSSSTSTSVASAGSNTLVLDGVDGEIRTDWTKQEIQDIYDMPLMELIFKAAAVHRVHFDPLEVQQSTLLSIKTGGCSENCGYCSQSQKFKTFVKPTPVMDIDQVLESARRAKAAGSTRFCMGSAWREVGNKRAFNKVLDMVKEVKGMGMEVCTTLGMLSPEQAKDMKEAGLTYYNHNLDTSREYYPKVVSTRTYDDRLDTLKNVREAGISVCCGGIIGMGEEEHDRVGLLHTLATLPEHPASVPINSLVPVAGTPIGDKMLALGQVPTWADMVRMIATARIVMPASMVRLSAGRLEFPVPAQTLMFVAGANSIFTGDTLLTTPNPEFNEDAEMLQMLGLRGQPAHTAPLAKYSVKQQQQQQQQTISQ